MHPDKWLETKEKIKSTMQILDERTETDEENHEVREIIELIGPLGKMKLEWITRPKLLDKKTSFSRRIGSETKVDYVYSEDEFVHNLKVYKEDFEGQWEEIKSGPFQS
jgi:hypothetical protein